MPVPTRAHPFHTDWSRIAKLIVHQSLKIEAGERVLLHVDPTYFPELTEQVRIEIVRAGAAEVGALLRDSPGLDSVRRKMRRREDPSTALMEDKAQRALFEISDVYIWLPTSWNMAMYQTEHILTRWQGRSVHFHWITDVEDPAVFQAFSEAYVRALFIDYAKLDATQRRIIDHLRGATVRVTDPRGSDLTLKVSETAHFHHGNGDASRDFIARHARKSSARDREVELPCGLIRTVDVGSPSGRLVVPGQHFRGRYVGALTFDFADGRLSNLTAENHNAWVAQRWDEETGHKDMVGEINIGTNPELRPIPGIDDIPYYGYGAGVIRIDIGENWESGGALRSSFFTWLTFLDATLTANGKTIVERGELVIQ